MKLIGLSTIAFFGSIECQNTAFANPVVDSIYQTNRNVRAPTYPRFNNVARIPSYKSSRFSSSGSNNNKDNSYQPSSYQVQPSTTTTNTVKKRVRVTLDHPNCKSLPNIADVQRRVESDPVIQRKLGVQVAGVLVNKFACTDSKDKMTVDFDFYVYNDVKASDFDLLFNQNNYDDQTNNVQGFEDQVKDGSLEPTLLKAIGMYHRISPYATEKPVISLISLVSKEDAVQEVTEQISQSLENATTQVTTLAPESENEIKNKDEIIEEIVNLTLNDRTLLDQIESLAEFIEGAEQNDLIDNLAEKISAALKKETLSVENISQLQKIATMAIIDYMANVSSEDINNSSASEETDFAIEESGQEGVFENEVVESILDSDYSSQLDKLTREVQKSIEDREIQLEFLEDQKSFVKDLFGEQAENKADYDLLDEDSDSTNDIEEIREVEKSSNLEGDVVELLNSLSKNENDAQENALKAILQEITSGEVEIESDDDGNKIIVPENDLKDLLLEYRDEPEIEVSATEIISEIMPDFFDEQNDEETKTNESNDLNKNLEIIKQERQEALLREIQASEEAKNEFRDAINETFQDQFLEENGETEEQIQSSFEVIESEEEVEDEQNDVEENEEPTDFEQIEQEAQIFDLDEDLEDSLTKNATINASDNTKEQSISPKQTIDINDIINIIEQNNNQNNLTQSNVQNELITTNFNDNGNNSTVSVPVDLMNTSLEEPHSFADNVVETVMSIFSR